MSIRALAFAHETDHPHLHGEARAKILALVDQINQVYRDHVKKPSGRVCDVCGKGDSGVHYKVGRILPGFEHRQDAMPTLRWPHASGWSLTYTRLASRRKAEESIREGVTQVNLGEYLAHKYVLSDEEVDRHFARFLALQLLKASKTWGATQQEKNT